MSISRIFSIIGDGNVRRNMTGLNVASRDSMKNAQIIDFIGAGPIDVAFTEVRPESTVCIVAAITDLLLSNGDCGTIFASIDPVSTDLHNRFVAFCQARPDLQVCSVALVCSFPINVFFKKRCAGRCPDSRPIRH